MIKTKCSSLKRACEDACHTGKSRDARYFYWGAKQVCSGWIQCPVAMRASRTAKGKNPVKAGKQFLYSPPYSHNSALIHLPTLFRPLWPYCSIVHLFVTRTVSPTRIYFTVLASLLLEPECSVTKTSYKSLWLTNWAFALIAHGNPPDPERGLKWKEFNNEEHLLFTGHKENWEH